MGVRIKFNPGSTLAFLIAFSIVAVFTGIMLGNIDPDISQELRRTFGPILALSIIVWIMFISLSLGRNIRRF